MVGLRRHEPDLVVQAELVDEVVRPLDLDVAVGTTGTADDEQQRIATAERMEGTDRDVGALERLDAPDEQDDRRVGRQVECNSRSALITRREERVLDTRRDDLDLALGIAVEAPELLLFLDAAHADRVGAVDQLGLGPIAPTWLGIAALGLHPRERVERRHERDVELVLDAVGDEPAQPVVGVHDVGATVLGEILEHTIGELVDDLGQCLLGQVVRTGLDVDHPVIGLDPHLRRQPVAVGPGVGGALETGLRQRRHHFAHVHVHAAAVARTGLEQRRRVQGNDGNSTHQRFKRYRSGQHSRSPEPCRPLPVGTAAGDAGRYWARKLSYTFSNAIFCSSVRSGSCSIASDTVLTDRSSSGRIPART